MTETAPARDEKKYNRIKFRVSLAEMAIDFIMLGILAFSGISHFLEKAARTVCGNDYGAFLAFFLIAGAALALLGLPLDIFDSYVVEHRFGLSRQNPLKWILERAKELLVSTVIGVPLSLLFFFFLRATGELWWIYFGVIVFVLSVVLARVAPVIIFPLFYKFRPVGDGEVRDRIMALMSSRGITVRGIFSFNMSKDTRKANAGFTGIGRSKRIILSDTLLGNFTPAEIAVVFAHEVGHYVKRHIARNLALGAALVFVSFFVCGTVHAWSLRHFGHHAIDDISAIPMLLFFLSVFGFLLTPATNALSRRYEREADRYALEATNDPDSFIGAMERLAELNLAERDPHPAKEFIFYGHPSIRKRIEAAIQFKNERL